MAGRRHPRRSTLLDRGYAVRIVVTGSQIRAIRQELDLAQAALAERIGMRSNTVARWERGEIGISGAITRLVKKIAAEGRGAKRGKHAGTHIQKTDAGRKA